MRLFFTFLILVLSSCYSDTQTQLIDCAANNDASCIQKYLSDGVDPNGLGKEAESPFYAALVNNHFEIADIFIKYGAKLDGKGKGQSHLERLVQNKNTRSINYLRNKGLHLEADKAAYELAKKINDKEVLLLFEIQ